MKILQKQHYDANKLKTAFKDNLKANVKTSHKKEVTIEKIMDYIASIFDLRTLTNDEVWLMKQFVCLPPNFHSYDLLLEFINPKASKRKTIFSETLHDLVAYGWLIEENNTYKMHRIIAEVCKSKFNIEVEDVDSLLDVVIDKLHTKNTINEIPQEYLPYISNFGNAISSIFVDSEKPEISTLQNNLALVLQALGDYQGAKKLLETAMKSDEKNYGKAHPTTAIRYSNLALVLKALGDCQGAKKLLETAMKSAEKNYGKAHPITAVSYSNLAVVLQSLGDYQGAKKILETAIKSAEKNYDKAHPTTAIRYHNLASVLINFKEYKQALDYENKALKIFEKHLPKNHPHIEIVKDNIAFLKKLQ